MPFLCAVCNGLSAWVAAWFVPSFLWCWTRPRFSTLSALKNIGYLLVAACRGYVLCEKDFS